VLSVTLGPLVIILWPHSSVFQNSSYPRSPCGSWRVNTSLPRHGSAAFHLASHWHITAHLHAVCRHLTRK